MNLEKLKVDLISFLEQNPINTPIHVDIKDNPFNWTVIFKTNNDILDYLKGITSSKDEERINLKKTVIDHILTGIYFNCYRNITRNIELGEKHNIFTRACESYDYDLFKLAKKYYK